MWNRADQLLKDEIRKNNVKITHKQKEILKLEIENQELEERITK